MEIVDDGITENSRRNSEAVLRQFIEVDHYSLSSCWMNTCVSGVGGLQTQLCCASGAGERR